MRLVPCSAPPEPLDRAPQTALQNEVEQGGKWDGFWSHSNDAYYARCISRDGAVRWYHITDEGISAKAEPARVLPFRGDAMRRASVIVAESPSGRPMLVGSRLRRGDR